MEEKRSIIVLFIQPNSSKFKEILRDLSEKSKKKKKIDLKCVSYYAWIDRMEVDIKQDSY